MRSHCPSCEGNSSTNLLRGNTMSQPASRAAFKSRGVHVRAVANDCRIVSRLESVHHCRNIQARILQIK